MASKAERKRRKRLVTLPGGEAVPQRAGQGRRVDLERAEDARRAPLEARLRVAGIPATPEALKAAVAPVFSDPVGLCIQFMTKAEAKDSDDGDAEAKARDEARGLWETFARIAAARRLYLMRNIGQTGDPQNSAIAMIPEPMQADPGLTVDLRSPEERDAAAKRAEEYWRGKLDAIQVPQWRMALRSAADGFGGPWWRDGKPTLAGQHVVAGLRVVVGVM